MLNKPAMGRPVLTRWASSAPTTGVRVDPPRTLAERRRLPVLLLNMGARTVRHAVRLADIRTLALEGTGKGSAMTTELALVEESQLLPVR